MSSPNMSHSNRSKKVFAFLMALLLTAAGIAAAAGAISGADASFPFPTAVLNDAGAGEEQPPAIGAYTPGSTYEDAGNFVYGRRVSLGAENLPADTEGKIPSFKVTDGLDDVAVLHASRSDDGQSVSYGLSFVGVGQVVVEMRLVDAEDAYIPVDFSEYTKEYIWSDEKQALVDPATGYSYDQSANCLVDDAGNRYDIVTGYRIDPDTGYLIDPSDNQPIVPEPEPDPVAVRTIDVGKYPMPSALTVQEKIYDGTDEAKAMMILTPLAGDENAVRCVLTDGHFDDAEVGEGKHVEFHAALEGEKAEFYELGASTVTSDDGVIVPAHLDWLEIDLADRAANNGDSYSSVLPTQPKMTILDAPDGSDVAPAPDSVYLEWYADPELTEKVDMAERIAGARGTVKTFYYKVCVPEELAGNFTGEKSSAVTVVMLDDAVQADMTFSLPASLTYGDAFQLVLEGADPSAEIAFTSMNENATVSSSGIMTVTGVGEIDIMATSHVEGLKDVEMEAVSVASPKALNISARVLDKVFDGTDAAQGDAVVEGLVNGDGEGDFSVELVNGRFIGENASFAGTDKRASFSVAASGAKTGCYSFPSSVDGQGDISKRSLSDLGFEMDGRMMVLNGDPYSVLPSSVGAQYAGETYAGIVSWYLDEACTAPVDPVAVFEGPKDAEFPVYYKISPSEAAASNFEGEVRGASTAVIADGNMVQPDFKIVLKDAPVYGDNIELGYKGGAEGASVTFTIASSNAHLLASGRTAKITDLGVLTIDAVCKADGYATKTDTFSVEVQKRKAVITAFARDKRYDGTVSAKCNPAIGHVLLSDDVDFAVTGTFPDPSIGANKTATFIVTATGAKKDYYDYPAVITSTASILPVRGVGMDLGPEFEDRVVENGSEASWLPQDVDVDIPGRGAIHGTAKWYSDAARTQEIDTRYVFSGARHEVKPLYYSVSFDGNGSEYVDGPATGMIDVVINTEMRPAPIDISVPARATYGDVIELSASSSVDDLGEVAYSVKRGSGKVDGNILTVTGIAPIVLEAASASGAKGTAVIAVDKKHLDIEVICDDKPYDGNAFATGEVKAAGFVFDDADEIEFFAANGRFDNPDTGTKNASFDVVTTSPRAQFYDFASAVTAAGTIR